MREREHFIYQNTSRAGQLASYMDMFNGFELRVLFVELTRVVILHCIKVILYSYLILKKMNERITDS